MSDTKTPKAEMPEITPEMIAAGLRELPGLWSPYEDAEAAVVRIYRAMESATKEESD